MAVDTAEIEGVIVGFLESFMSLEVTSRDEPLDTLLTSIQQFELLFFIEEKFAVVLSQSIFAYAGSVTTATLAERIAANLPPG